ncbi:MAG: T9SS type A sorting domain-containing protein [Bacteroidetes bacterium]|nr:T9SS type A sorting domain-containing protein [Bacteroidota bacterium]
MTLPINQLYVDNNGEGNQWPSITLDETKSLKQLFLQRVFSSGYSWTQSGGVVDWNTPVNTSVWDSSATLYNSALISKLRIHSAGQLILAPGAQMNCFDSVEIGNVEGLWLKSDASYTASLVDGGIISYINNGSATVEQYLKQDQWHGYCIPVNSTNTTPFILRQLLSKWYDEPLHKYRSIVNPAGDSILNNRMLGYLLYSNSSLTSNSTVAVTGSLNTGNTSYSMTNHIGAAGPDGWHLIGNPYPSAIDWLSNGFSLSEVDPTIYVFHPETGNYFFWNRHDQIHTTGASSLIASQQGFYMHASVPGSLSGSISLDNTARLHSDQPFYKTDTLSNEQLILTVKGNNFRDETRIRFDSAATVLFDPHHDAYKLDGADEAPQLYTVLDDSTRVALNTRPWSGFNTTIPLGFHIGVASTDTILASNLESFLSGIVIWLEDKKTGGWSDLTQWPMYVFSTLPQDSADRFLLHFMNPYTGLYSISAGFVQIYSYDDAVYVMNKPAGNGNGKVSIYDLVGRLVFKDKLKHAGLNKYVPGIQEGYYVVKVITPEQTSTQKVFLK